ncbi:MerR family transcriptional regulator [Hydrogenimonas sp.]
MPLKMSQLVKLSKTPKSTILYYIKEGLLPEPKKVKPNVHLYDEEYVERIKLIRYLQHNFHATIDQIKTIFRQNDFDFSKGFESVLDMIDIVTAPSSEKIYSDEAFCKLLDISKEKLDRWVERGALFRRKGGFSEKEREVATLLLTLERLDPKERLLNAYIEHAKALARTEVELAKEILETKNLSKNEAAKALFDAALVLKPYLFNMHLVHLYQNGGDER